LLTARPDDQPRQVITSSALQRDGRKRQLHWSGAPLCDAAGLPFGVLVIGHDVTDLYEAQRRALQAERLAAIGQMATGLAHESRNALQRIGASAEMLELEMEGNPAALELLGRIQQSQAHLHQLLEEVRNYAAPVVLDRSAGRVTEAWREAWDLLSAQRRGRDAVLHERLLASDLVAEADRFRLVQVFRNLLDNALAAASDPVRIEICCEPAQIASTAALRIRVRDNGPGLSAEQRQRIFEPFYTTKPTGTGLGTAIAQRLIEAHGGTLAIGDAPPPGTEIIVTLPCRAVA
jgi:signal transduction histidine kinase